MAQCRHAGCDNEALPLSRFCEQHVAMGAKESSVFSRGGGAGRRGAKKKAAAKKKRSK